MDPAVLEAIAQEARQCFLEEDAPVYLEALEDGLEKMGAGQEPDYKGLMRAAHSIKGGAGVAQIPELSQLAHKLEDLLEGWNEGKVSDRALALDLVQQGIEELTFMLSSAQDGQPLQENPNLLQSLDDFNATLKAAAPEPELDGTAAPSSARVKLIKAALESDLENCLQTFEKLSNDSPSDEQLTEGILVLADECMLLGEAFDLPWLVSGIEDLADAAEKGEAKDLDDRAKTAIEKLRAERETCLQELEGKKPSAGESHNNGNGRAPSPPAETASAPPAAPTPAQHPNKASAAPAQLRVPLQRIDRMGSAIGELLTSHERLTLQQQQLRQASQNLKRLVEQVKPVRDEVQTFYDRMSTVSTTSADGEEGEFDALEMDRYTTLHSSLQTFEELITQVQETRVDIDLVSRELASDLNQVRRDLDRLYNDVNASRLVPFKTFAQRFLPQVKRLNQRCGKAAELVVRGENVLIDKVVLEQLQTPLTHLLNNSMDHGLETPEERAAVDKSPTAQVRLQAQTEGSEVVITFGDDGRGIDLGKVYQKAVDRGICPPEIPMTRLRREDILDFIFQSGFSTAAAVSDVSGRGVGLDVVRTQVRMLRGSVEVDTLPGRGTTFTIRLPSSMSLLSLLLCQVQQQLVAIPADTILDVIPFEDVAYREGLQLNEETGKTPLPSSMTWRDRVLSLSPAIHLLPYSDLSALSVDPRVVLILKGPSAPLAVAIDGIVDERQLIVKPFDDTVVVPPYVAGCTILGTGEAVPVILPRFLNPKAARERSAAPTTRSPKVQTRTILIAEDSTGARRSLERILTHAGFVVVACREGQEALRELERRQGAIDFVISDVEMPVLNGFDLLAKIRSHSSWYALPVVMLTSRTGDRHRQKAMSLGANDYLGKPVTPTELLACISDLMPD